MKVIDTGVLERLSRVKIVDNKTVEELEKIISKPNMSFGTTTCPYLKVYSYKGNIINQQLVVLRYYENDYNKNEVYEGVLLNYNNVDNPKFNNLTLNWKMANLIRESILFDMYLNKLISISKDEITSKYLEYNELLMNSLANNKPMNSTMMDFVGEKTYNNFISKLIVKNKRFR
jgi:hypothetical protein